MLDGEGLKKSVKGEALDGGPVRSDEQRTFRVQERKEYKKICTIIVIDFIESKQ